MRKQVGITCLILLTVFIGTVAYGREKIESPQTIAHTAERYFSSIPLNPNLHRKMAYFSDPLLEKQAGILQENTPFVIEQLFVNEQGKRVFKVAEKGYLLADRSVIYDDTIQEIKEEQKTLWLKPGFKVYEQALINGTKEKKSDLAPYKKINIIRSAKTERGRYVEIEGKGWIDERYTSQADNRMEKVQELLENQYKDPSFGIYVKQLSTGKTAGIHQDTLMYAASVSKLPYLYYAQEQLNQKKVQTTTTYKYTEAVNDFKGGYDPSGSGSLPKTPDNKDYTVQELIDKVAKESDNVGHNILGYYVSNRSDEAFQKTIDQIAGKHWDVEERNVSAKMAGNVMEAIYKQNGTIIDSLSETRFDDQRIARDLPVKVAHKIGDAYDFRHDVAIVYAGEPYILSIFTEQSNYDTISKISKEVYEVLK